MGGSGTNLSPSLCTVLILGRVISLYYSCLMHSRRGEARARVEQGLGREGRGPSDRAGKRPTTCPRHCLGGVVVAAFVLVSIVFIVRQGRLCASADQDVCLQGPDGVV
jgi:hypothetical protein